MRGVKQKWETKTKHTILKANIAVLFSFRIVSVLTWTVFFLCSVNYTVWLFPCSVCACNAYRPSSVKLVIPGLMSTVYKECASLEPSATVHYGWLDSILEYYISFSNTPPRFKSNTFAYSVSVHTVLIAFIFCACAWLIGRWSRYIF